MRAADRGIFAALLLAVSLLITVSPVSAREPHENPDTVPVVFTPTALLQYYSDTQDYLLRKNAVAVEARLAKMPFANVPAAYSGPIESLNRNEVDLAFLITDVDAGISNLVALVSQSRIDEATGLAWELRARLDRGDLTVEMIRRDTERIGLLAGADRAPGTSRLAVTYRELTAKADKKKELLGLLRALIEASVATSGPFRQTVITLQVDPTSAFVGDMIKFKGFLNSETAPLADRQVDILVNGTEYTSASTGMDGGYEGVLQVPYEYLPYINLEALYVPRGDDRGLYLASKSPAVRLQVLFYSATLNITLPGKAYPGRDMTIAGIFQYDSAPVPDSRALEVYIDDLSVGRVEVGREFSIAVPLPNNIEPGRHVAATLAPPAGRYAPASTSGYLNVVKLAPVIRLDIPRIAWFPGIVQIEGQISSELGPADGAKVTINIGESQSHALTSADGGFTSRFERGPGLELIGSQMVKVDIVPSEPWHSSASATGTIIVVNWLNSSGVIGLAVVLGIVLWRRLRRFALNRPQAVRRGPVSSTPTTAATLTNEASQAEGRAHHQLLVWYQRIVELIQRVIRVVFRPQQTMREFLKAALPKLGPAGALFAELTYKTERLLYSRWKPTDEEMAHIDRLGGQIQTYLRS